MGVGGETEQFVTVASWSMLRTLRFRLIHSMYMRGRFPGAAATRLGTAFCRGERMNNVTRYICAWQWAN